MNRPTPANIDRTLRFVPVLLAAVTAGCSSGLPQDLLGPPPQVGQVYRTKSKCTMTNGTITVTGDGVSEKAQYDMTRYRDFSMPSSVFNLRTRPSDFPPVPK